MGFFSCCTHMIAYQSAIIPIKLHCPKKFLVTHLKFTFALDSVLFWLLPFLAENRISEYFNFKIRITENGLLKWFDDPSSVHWSFHFFVESDKKSQLASKESFWATLFFAWIIYEGKVCKRMDQVNIREDSH